MTNKQPTGWRFAAAFALVLLALAAGKVGNDGPISAALADEPDFLVLNPEGE